MKKGTFVIEGYDRKKPFSGFLPGLCGIHGTPIWCYYVNRGQCVSSFGVEDKEHGIMEFFPAHQAYQNTSLCGFRTFVRKDGVCLELFRDAGTKKKMFVEMNSLAIEEEDRENQLSARVDYFALPGEKIGALVRRLCIRNTGEHSIRLEVLDGMPSVVPYGVGMSDIKQVGQTIMAWMQTEKLEERTPRFMVRASTADTAAVTPVNGRNYGLCFDEQGEKLAAVVDPTLVFGYDTSFREPIGLKESSLGEILAAPQITVNQYPCCFFAREKDLLPGEAMIFYELIGQTASGALLDRFVSSAGKLDQAYFERKKEEADRLTEELCEVIRTKTASESFDAYSAYTYMDNVLRGGHPIRLPGGKIFHVYSRKHGDLERDYNFFRMLPEFYSQGNGNFRDVNQNRRCEPFFTPFVGAESIVKFYSLIQIDGYNPLEVEKVTYTLPKEKAEAVFDLLPQEKKEEMVSFFEKPFTPGGFFRKLDELGIEDVESEEAYFTKVMQDAEDRVNANFGEGYWSDHWTYNLDLVESYLSVFPEKEEELLYRTPVTYYRASVPILPRKKRYVKTENGIRQYHFLDEEKKYSGEDKCLRDQAGQGKIVESPLIEKLIVLCLTKYAALDAYAMGVEMEGGKPGWYDALNGMPGLFGSSVAETCELARILSYTIDALKKYPLDMELPVEVVWLLQQMQTITERHSKDIAKGGELLAFWNERGDVKESYWEKTFGGISGDRQTIRADEVAEALSAMFAVVDGGIQRAQDVESGVCPAYFTYEMTEFEEDGGGITPKRFEVRKVPLFLEGAVRFFKLNKGRGAKKEMYENVKKSDLYDAKLAMYKVNASLRDASYELGRAKAFTPGWLENESIWVHMEYKYLLELLKAGLYEEFAGDFHQAAIPFLDPDVYGRSIYENSSFIASSVNPDPARRGQGFVARLSGSTVEFLQIWILMMFGHLFSCEGGELVLRFAPTLPAYLVGKQKQVEAMLLGRTKVIYEMKETRDYFPGNYRIDFIELCYQDGSVLKTESETLKGADAQDVRSGKVEEIRIGLS